MHLLQKLGGYGPENIAFVYGNGQSWPKVMTTPVAYPMDGFISEYLLNGALSPNMNVNGSVTPVIFEYIVPAPFFFALSQHNLVITGANITADKFGPLASLTNGILWQILKADNSVAYSFGSGAPIKANYEFSHVAGSTIQNTGGQDQLTILWEGTRLGILGVLETGWKIRVTVRDNLTAIPAFQATVHGGLVPNDYVYNY